ncbi:hypothetical protein F751_3445 [Auxenochlorella protothecoides]|uniref:Cytochrome c oxidase assembly protein COX16, mitochondrial n=1 Tax=Auxenochlorella protothecoides TaxID=3075 RepID=A0A087SC00_AUXPR|nr:hypothetical protein F751_3445 [Auxenochlorella protothecoides]KFM23254.1 hypothetical protein F751_3445 [Auxenochlorella protothecoides]RMZ53496.1 hypothetical protein APUTEX25_003318 [Auxenochlorella protothecoides]|eukprot:RMZ53496.1 hypothetical protein APUTEX25_003318 [Auxenochlorella protothecoides]
MSKNKSFAFAKAGLPFIVLTVGGWVGLSKTIQGRIDAQEAQTKELNLHAPAAKQRSKKFDLHEEMDRLRANVDIDHYELKPVPRLPDEDE